MFNIWLSNYKTTKERRTLLHREKLQKRYETKESTIRFFFEQNGAADRIQVFKSYIYFFTQMYKSNLSTTFKSNGINQSDGNTLLDDGEER